jgi:hypothetical protein
MTETGKQNNEPSMKKVTLPMPESFHALQAPPLPPDLRIGVRDVTLGIRGTDDEKAVRSMFHVLETSNTIPSFKIGARTCVRMSSVRATFWMQEKRAWRGEDQELLVRVHILLNSILTLVSEHNGNAIDERDQAHLLPLIAAAARTIQRVLQIGGA